MLLLPTVTHRPAAAMPLLLLRLGQLLLLLLLEVPEART
jgi:hypothetical protein